MNTERVTPLVTVRVEKLCDECGAPLRFDGVVLTSNPPQYQHSCPAGHRGATLDHAYPRVEHRAVP